MVGFESYPPGVVGVLGVMVRVMPCELGTGVFGIGGVGGIGSNTNTSRRRPADDRTGFPLTSGGGFSWLVGIRACSTYGSVDAALKGPAQGQGKWATGYAEQEGPELGPAFSVVLQEPRSLASRSPV